MVSDGGMVDVRGGGHPRNENINGAPRLVGVVVSRVEHESLEMETGLVVALFKQACC